jgi:hypothetical protein
MIMITSQVCAQQLRCNRLLNDVLTATPGYVSQHRCDNDPTNLTRQVRFRAQTRRRPDPQSMRECPDFAIDLVRAAALPRPAERRTGSRKIGDQD